MRDPLKRLQQYWKKARAKKDPTADYFLLGTVDGRGNPHVRTVLIKTLDRDGIGFVTNKTGPKVAHLKKRNKVEGCMVWPSLRLQVRVTGTTKKMPQKILQRLWDVRQREAQILYSLGLRQSSKIPSFEFLKRKVDKLHQKWKEKKEIPWASYYIGLVVVPQTIEFLLHNTTRVNKREFFQKNRKRWRCFILAP